MPPTPADTSIFRRPQPLSDHVYDQLKSLIVSNELRPGETLIEERIATRWGISRTPLRMALARLEQEGLVQTVPYKGRIVSQIRLEDLHDVYHVREVLELAALDLVTPTIPAEKLDEMSRLFDDISIELERECYDKYIPSDAAFHNLIKEHVPNKLLAQMIDSIHDQVSRIRNFSHAWHGEHMREAFLEHTVILAAMQRRDAEAAKEAMRTHLRNVASRATLLLRQPELPDAGNDADDLRQGRA